jgi:sulfoxide reductase heme-binding subunit YedZ
MDTLGGRRWQLLHRLVYITAAAGVVHYYWLVKSEIRQPVLCGVIVTILLAYRILVFRRSRPTIRAYSRIRFGLTTRQQE